MVAIISATKKFGKTEQLIPSIKKRIENYLLNLK